MASSIARKYYLHCFNLDQKIGAKNLQRIDNQISDFESVWRDPAKIHGLKLTDELKTKIRQIVNEIDPADEIRRLQKLGIELIYYQDENYPHLLREIPDFPPIFYWQGELAGDEQCLAIVGARKNSPYGQTVAEKIVGGLAGSGLTIVSGLALGIDAISHHLALENDLKTIAVLGTGLDRIYPASNSRLAEEIISARGAIISEFPPATPSFAYNFPIRNRLIAGLSLGTLVIEAALDSGSLITASLANEYNREVFSVPHPIFSASGEGANNLLKLGAKLVTSSEDILTELNIQTKISQTQVKKIAPANPTEEKILKFISGQPVYIDDLQQKTKLEIGELSSILTMMEMKGMIKNIGGGNFMAL